jgi:hypothetical protein
MPTQTVNEFGDKLVGSAGGTNEFGDREAMQSGSWSNFANSFAQPTAQDTATATAQPQQPPQPLTESIAEAIGQAGAAVYRNPIWHPGLRILADMTGSPAEEVYNNMQNPTTFAGKLGRAAGNVAAVLPIAGPIGEAVAGAGIPLVSQSAVLSGGATGLAYGGLERGAQELQGQTQNLTNPLDAAKDFALYGAANRVGSTIVGGLLQKAGMPSIKGMELPSGIIQRLWKQGTTAEGVGSILGGALAGSAISNDDDRLASGIMGAAVNALSPTEQYNMMVGAGEKMGKNAVHKALGMFNRGQQETGDIYMKNPDAVEAAGQIGPRGETTANVAANTIVGGFDAVRKMAQVDVHDALTDAEQKAKTGNMVFTNGKTGIEPLDKIEGLVRSISGPSPIKSIYDNLRSTTGVLYRYAVDGTSAFNLGVAPEDAKGCVYYVNGADMGKLPPELKPIPGRAPQLSPQGMEVLRSKMMDIAYSGDGNASIAHDIAHEASSFLKSSQIDPEGKYARGMKSYEDMYNAQGKLKLETGTPMPDGNFDPNKLSESLAQNYHFQEDTAKGNRKRALEDLDSYFNNIAEKRDPRFSQFTTKPLIDNYLAYEAFNKPQSAGITKIMPMRIIGSTAIGGLASMLGMGVVGGSVGALAAYHMSSPEGWKPLMRGAYNVGNRTMLQRLMATRTKSYMKR